jgi:hypothetical protein
MLVDAGNVRPDKRSPATHAMKKAFVRLPGKGFFS